MVLALLGLAPERLSGAENAPPLKLLFLGDNGHHRPGDRFHELAPVLEKRGIALKYTDDVNVLKSETLKQFDGLILYANIDRIEPAQADALLNWVEAGGAFIPLHCATYCFRNDERIVALMGGQFQRHGAQVFSTIIAEPDHPLMKGFAGFRSYDETYIHHLHNEKNRTVLEFRAEGDQAEGRDREPWTWVRTQGQGRVFYTAWGHDQRTWTHPGFQNLMERGIRWACGQDPGVVPPYVDSSGFNPPAITAKRTDVQPFEYIDVGAKIPNYVAGNQWGVQGAPLTKMQLPLPAAESLKHFVTPVGFHLELYASEPELVGKPVAMNWDERGRLWVCETVDYPNELQDRNLGHDHIRICEDTDGDGRADKFTLFAEKLSIPTALIFHRGGVVVQNGTETLWLKDNDGDDRADERRVLISNWNLVDTHGGVSNFRYGLDNWIYAMQGYNNSEPVLEPSGEKIPSFRMGFFRFRLSQDEKPVVTELEFLRSTDNNTWGLGISEEGLIFGSTANRNPSNFLPIPNRYYERVKGWGPRQLETIADTYLFKPITDRIRQVDQHGGYTAGTGHALYTARNYPAQWWNRVAFVCGPTGKLVGTFVLNRDGAGFKSTSPFNLVASDDEWTAPIMAEVGPDGNVWILDWYNYIVQHNPTPHGFETGKGRAYESDLRDKKHGRIYRLIHDAQPAGPSWSLGNDSRSLVRALTHPTMLVRQHAQRLLVERGDLSVIPDLLALIADQTVDAAGLNVGAIHALWTLSGLNVIDDKHPEVLTAMHEAIRHPSAGVRRNAVQVVPADRPEIKAAEAVSLFQGETDAQVRLAIILKVADTQRPEVAAPFAASLISQPDVLADRWLREGLTSAAAAGGARFFAELSGRKLDGIPAPAVDVIRIAAEHVARSRPSSAEVELLVQAMPGVPAGALDPLLTGLAEGWPKDHAPALTPATEAGLVALLRQVPAQDKGRVVRLASSWKSREIEKFTEEIVTSLAVAVADANLPAGQRVDAARQLIGFRANHGEIVDQLLGNITPQAPPDFVASLIEAVGTSEAENLGEQLIELIPRLTPSAKEAALRVLIGRTRTTGEFLSAVEAGRLQLADLSLDQKQMLSNHPDKGIAARAKKLLAAGGGLPNPDRQKVVEELLPITQLTGNADLGLEIFKKHCAKCHKHGDVGETIGPNLTGMAVHPKAELLVHILDPSRSVEGNFRLYTVVTTEGRILTGMMAGESRTAIDLVDTEAKRQTLQREDIEELIASPKSLMPEGFEKQVTKDELSNLLEFLTKKGKYVPLDLRKAASIVSTKPMFYGVDAVERLVFDDWGPKRVGEVPFLLVDPQGDRVPNVIMLYGPIGPIPPKMPKEVTLPVNAPAKAIHILGGVGGWSFPAIQERSVSLIVRLKYADGTTEDHELRNGVHYADYIRRIDVPESTFAFNLGGRQVRSLTLQPRRQDVPVSEVQLIKGPDNTAPVVVAITVETP